jgi:hypothetical protein
VLWSISSSYARLKQKPVPDFYIPAIDFFTLNGYILLGNIGVVTCSGRVFQVQMSDIPY